MACLASMACMICAISATLLSWIFSNEASRKEMVGLVRLKGARGGLNAGFLLFGVGVSRDFLFLGLKARFVSFSLMIC